MNYFQRIFITLLCVIFTQELFSQETNIAFKDSVTLTDVVVKGKLPHSYVKGDAIVTRVIGSVLENAGTAENVLNRLPNIKSQDGIVSVQGRGQAEVYINGRKVTDDNELDQLHSEEIKRIEVIQHPGAQYDTSVKAVVRIITKKPEGTGLGVLARTTAGHQYDWHGNQVVNTTYSDGPLDLALGLAGYISRNGEYSDSEKRIHNAKDTQRFIAMPCRCENKDRQHTFQLTYKTNLTLNDSVSFGCRYGFTQVPYYRYWGNIETKIINSGVKQEKTYSKITLSADTYRHSTNAYFRGKIGMGWLLDINMDGYWYNSKNPNDTKEYTDSYLDDSDELAVSHVTSTATTKNSLYAIKAYAEHALWGGSMTIGTEWTYNKRPTTYHNDQRLQILPDDEAEMTDKSISVFGEYSHNIGILQATIGARYEHLDNIYKQFGKKREDGSHVYDNVYPTISLSATAGNVQMLLSYSNDVSRPKYRQMMANIFYTNKYYLEQGNPTLKQSTTNSLAYNLAYKWLNVTLNWDAIHNDWMGETRGYSEEHPEIVLSTYRNVADYNQYYISATAQPQVGIWTPVIGASMTMQDFKAVKVDEKIEMSKPLFNFTLKNNWKLPLGIFCDADFSAQSTGDSGNTHVCEWQYGLNIDLYKTFFNKALVVMLEINDVCESSHYKSTTYDGLYSSDFEYETKRDIALSVRYKINLAKDKYQGKGAGVSQSKRV